ncbi:acyltransferase [Catellatospora sp. TT07R-123]|uniref:acyltransferase family protein n=1 Tax=Catellatospora sp. TT07R-123 TaxID=2733863 RepID=UPI001B1334E2|nr:acyltransferase [Catellatospora sp. TT07R-123]GHJ48419.1 acyltransferase [Catellatospora sp. TT07R-123]
MSQAIQQSEPATVTLPAQREPERDHAEQPALAEAPAPGVAAPAKAHAPRLLVLDGLRLAAALMVVCYHLIGDRIGVWQPKAENLFGPAHGPAMYGFLGVQLFFIISGFVICMSAWGRPLGDFFVSRAVRLYPAYWLAVPVTAALLYLVPITGYRPSGRDLLANLTMMQDFLGIKNLDQSYWTLAVEMMFYLLFAVVVARGLTYRRVVVFCSVWTVVSVLAPRFGSTWLSTVTGAGTACYFIAGIALYLIHRFGQNLLLWGIVGLSWLLAIVRLPGLADARHVAFTPTAAIVTAFFVVMAAVALGWFSWVRAGWMATAGALTYPLYLIHQTVGLAVIKKAQAYVPAWPLLLGVLAGLLAAAWLIHRLVERPVSRWMKRRLTAALGQMRAAR